jgi:hypothetical protein
MKFIESRGAYLIPWDSITNVPASLRANAEMAKTMGPAKRCGALSA